MPTQSSIQLINFTVDMINLKRASFIIPKYQRGKVWTLPDKKLLVDTILRGFPIQALMMYRDGDTYVVNDGQQKLATMLDFLDGDFHTFSEAELNRYAPIGLPLLEPHRRFSEMTVGAQQDFLFYRVPIQEIDHAQLTEDEMTEIFRRINNTGVKVSTGELLATFTKSKAHKMIQEKKHHIFFKSIYGGEVLRCQDIHMLYIILAMELHGFPYNVKQENLMELAAGKDDTYITEEIDRRIDETLIGITNLFLRARVKAITDIIPIYQTALKLRERGYDLLSSREGCLAAWFEQARGEPVYGMTWGDRRTFAQMVHPSMQGAFWRIQEQRLFHNAEKLGLVKTGSYISPPTYHKKVEQLMFTEEQS